jgi:hypothetical protein
MGVELRNENNESIRKELTPLELGSGILVAAASAYIMLARIIPQTDDYIATNTAPKIAGDLMLWSRLGYGLIVSAAGTGAAWATERLQKK